MLTVEVLLALVLLLALGLASISLRRRFLSRGGGAIELSLRLKPRRHGRGWVLGVGRFVGDDLQWFRVFSLSTRPRRTLSRRDLQVRGRRAPAEHEAFALLKGAEVVELTSAAGPVDIALDGSALTGFLAWLEARPPGATLPA
ncbi:MAG: hypothetical protein JWN87_697 [Frankiales bacterium]|nr:hypothetical protein [Frankiales bacterium]